MLFFYALSEILPHSCDPDEHFMRGITCNNTHLAVGTSLGIALVFSTSNDNNNQCIPSFGMSKPESSGYDQQSNPNIVLLDRINCKDIPSSYIKSTSRSGDNSPRGPGSSRGRGGPHVTPNPAITVMARWVIYIFSFLLTTHPFKTPTNNDLIYAGFPHTHTHQYLQQPPPTPHNTIMHD